MNELAVLPRVAGGVARIRKRPTIALEELDILGVGRVDVEGDLEAATGETGQRHELPEFVSAQAVPRSLILERCIWASPHRERRNRALRAVEPAAARPFVQHNRRPGHRPGQAARGNAAFRFADVLGNRHVRVVLAKRLVQPKRLPHLAESRVDIEEHTLLGGAQDLLVLDKAHHVHQRLGRSDPFDDLRAAETNCRRAVVAQKRVASVQTEALHDVDEVANVPRSFNRRGRTSLVDRHGGFQSIEKQHVPAKLLEAEEVLEEHPGMASTPGSLSKRPGNDD